MKKRNKFISSIAALLMMGQIATYADVPQWSFTVDGKAYSLDAQLDEKMGTEIKEVFENGSKYVHVKKDGKWFSKEGKVVSSKAVGSVVYKNEDGSYVSYDSRDGEVVQFGVKDTIFTSDKKVEINYTTVGSAESMLDKANYKVGGVALTEKDKVELSKDGKSVIITLETPLKAGNIATSVEVGTVKDLNEKETTSVKNEILVVNSNTGLDKLGTVKSNVNVIVDGANLKGATIEGDLHISGKDAKVEGIKVSGNLVLDAEAKEGTIIINNTTAKGIVVENAANQTVKLASVKADNLTISGASAIEAGNGTAIKSTYVEAEANLLGKGGAFGNVKVEFAPETEKKELKLDGNFKGSTFEVTFDAKIATTVNTSDVSLVLDTEIDTDQIALSGKFEEVKLENKVELTVDKDSKVDKIVVNKDASGVEIKTEEGAKIGEVEGEGNVTGDGTVVGPEKPSTGGGGGGYVPPTVTVTKQDEILAELVKVGKELKTVKPLIDGMTYTNNNSDNQLVIDLKDDIVKDGVTLGDIFNNAHMTDEMKAAIKADIETLRKLTAVNLEGQLAIGIKNEATGKFEYKSVVELILEETNANNVDDLLGMKKEDLKEIARKYYWANRNKEMVFGLYTKATEATEDSKVVVLEEIKFKSNKEGATEKTLFSNKKLESHEDLLAAFEMVVANKYETPVKNFLGTYTIKTNVETLTVTIK